MCSNCSTTPAPAHPVRSLKQRLRQLAAGVVAAHRRLDVGEELLHLLHEWKWHTNAQFPSEQGRAPTVRARDLLHVLQMR